MRLFASSLLTLCLLGCGDKDDGSDGADGSDGSEGLYMGFGAVGGDGADGTDGGATDADADGYPEGEDCDDDDPAINPGATEVCDGIDNDCDDDIDEGVTTTFYADEDTDSYGDPTVYEDACEAPEGYVTDDADCDDTNPAINPAATEVCDGSDNNCDDAIDEGVTTTFYADADADGYGDAATTVEACIAPSGHVTDATDCDDTTATSYPGAAELCDGADNDCDSDTTDEDGQVTWTDGAGAMTDLTSTMTGDVTLSDAGTATFCDGTYTVNLDLGADVTLASQNGAATTILDGGAAGTVVSVGAGYAVSVAGLTLTNGEADEEEPTLGVSGGGVYCTTGASVTVTDSAISGNSSSRVGGGIAAFGCDVTVSDSSIDDNEATYGGGIVITDATLTLTDTDATDNTADTSGGFLYISGYTADASASITGGEISGNLANYAAAFYIDGYDYTSSTSTTLVTVEGASVVSNTSTYYGAAYVTDEATLRSIDSDWGSSATSDDNSAVDVQTQSGDDYTDYAAGAWFECTDDGCADTVSFDGMTGAYTVVSGLATTTATYDCYQVFDIQSGAADTTCDDCTFAFEATWTLDTTSAVLTDCSIGATSLSYGLGFAADPPSYSAPVIYYGGSGSWYPAWYGTFSDGTVTGYAGVIDYTYTSGTTTYYYSNYTSLEMTPY